MTDIFSFLAGLTRICSMIFQRPFSLRCYQCSSVKPELSPQLLEQREPSHASLANWNARWHADSRHDYYCVASQKLSLPGCVICEVASSSAKDAGGYRDSTPQIRSLGMDASARVKCGLKSLTPNKLCAKTLAKLDPDLARPRPPFGPFSCNNHGGWAT